MKTYLAISAVGRAQTNLLDQLSRAVLDCGCSIRESRMSLMGNEFAMIFLVEGNWNNVAKLEAVLPGLEKRLELALTAQRAELRRAESNLLPYAVEVVALDQPGIVHHLANFFSTRGITICDLFTNAYAAANSGSHVLGAYDSRRPSRSADRSAA